MKKLLFFVNPKAGRGSADAVEAMSRYFAAAGYEVSLRYTKARGDLTETLAREGENYDTVAAFGGDGTLHEASAGIWRLPPELRPALICLPGGTVNDFAYTLGIPQNPVKAAEVLSRGGKKEIDLGLFCGEPFNYVAAFGLFTDVSYRTPQKEKYKLGRLAYLLDGAKSIKDMHTISAEFCIGGQTRREDVLAGLVCSTASIGGFRFRRSAAVPDDGLFEVLLIRKPKTMLAYKSTISALLNARYDHENIFFCRSDNISLHFREAVDFSLDGEFGGSFRDAEIFVAKKALPVIFPPQI